MSKRVAGSVIAVRKAMIKRHAGRILTVRKAMNKRVAGSVIAVRKAMIKPGRDFRQEKRKAAGSAKLLAWFAVVTVMRKERKKYGLFGD